MTSHTDVVTAEVVGLIGEIVARFNDEYERAAGQHQLTAVQAKTLALLDYRPLPMRRIAEFMHCDPSNVTGIVDRLAARDLVSREADPADRRVKHITLTGRGAEVVADLRGSMSFAAQPLAGLGADERTALRDLLVRLLGPGDQSRV